VSSRPPYYMDCPAPTAAHTMPPIWRPAPFAALLSVWRRRQSRLCWKMCGRGKPHKSLRPKVAACTAPRARHAADSSRCLSATSNKFSKSLPKWRSDFLSRTEENLLASRFALPGCDELMDPDLLSEIVIAIGGAAVLFFLMLTVIAVLAAKLYAFGAESHGSHISALDGVPPA